MLNKNGWGLKEMLLYSGIIVLFFLVAIYYIVSMYKEIDIPVSEVSYQDLEKQLEDNTLIYLNDYYTGFLDSDGIIINRSVLKANNLDVALIDSNNNACSGYVYANKTHGVIGVKAYIKCKGYTTNGYEEAKS